MKVWILQIFGSKEMERLVTISLKQLFCSTKKSLTVSLVIACPARSYDLIPATSSEWGYFDESKVYESNP